MAVYVDQEENQLGRMKMCHMIADTIEELHEMADKIGMKREWFQPKSFPHYDVSKERRALAIKLGAKEIGRREVVAVMRRFRESQ
jgi:hypothetical protein